MSTAPQLVAWGRAARKLPTPAFTHCAPTARPRAAAGAPGLLPPSSSAPAMDLDYHPVPASKQPSMREIAARHWTEYAGLAVLIVLLVRGQLGAGGWVAV